MSPEERRFCEADHNLAYVKVVKYDYTSKIVNYPQNLDEKIDIVKRSCEGVKDRVEDNRVRFFNTP